MTRPLGPFDEQTADSHDALGYGATALRRRPEVQWSDARGAHTAALDGRTLVGSADNAGLVVADPAVSRLHCELEPRDDGVWVRDLGSRNGTFVDNVLVAHARVPQGGRVRIGATVLALRDAPAPTPVPLWPTERFGPMVGRSVAMRELFARLARFAPADATVLVQGETGTGKELVARALHEASPRRDKPFVIVDCGALPEALLESELFGHVKGAFTGAVASRAGAIEEAQGGTVFLDEVGELPLAMQPKLLRVLESRTIRRVGESAFRKVDVRFVSATHRDLGAMVNSGAFREDLYFRLAVLPVTVPPLRARPDDVPALVEHFLATEGGGAAVVSAELARELAQRPWPGNVRELRNFVARARVVGAREALAMAGGEREGAAAPRSGVAVPLPAVPVEVPFKELREQWMDHLEREYIATLLARHKRNTALVAQAAGLDRSYVHRLMRKHDL